MKNVFYLVLLLLFFGISCKEERVARADPRKTTDTLEIALQSYLKEEIILTPKAAEAVKKWPGYDDISDAINSLGNAKIENLKSQGNKWIDASAKMLLQLPDTIANNPIESRVTVLFTKANTLQQQAAKIEVDTSLVNREATEFYNAFQNLKLQLNLKYQKSIEELLQEYEVISDSIIRPEENQAVPQRMRTERYRNRDSKKL